MSNGIEAAFTILLIAVVILAALSRIPAVGRLVTAAAALGIAIGVSLAVIASHVAT